MQLNVTIGHYHYCNSLVHRLDPRTKILILLLLIVSVFLNRNPWGFLIAGSFLFAAILLARLPLGLILRSLRKMIWLFVSIMILHTLFIGKTGSYIISLGPIKVAWQGVYSGLMAGCRIMLIIVGASILNSTTIPLRLADGINMTLRPLSKIRLPVHQFTIMMVITLHFIPTLFMEMEKLISVQKARGGGSEGRSTFGKIRALMPILPPLLRSSFRWADELAIGMESRCYHGNIRSHLYDFTFKKSDFAALVVTGVMIILMLALIKLFF